MKSFVRKIEKIAKDEFKKIKSVIFTQQPEKIDKKAKQEDQK